LRHFFALLSGAFILLPGSSSWAVTAQSQANAPSLVENIPDSPLRCPQAGSQTATPGLTKLLGNVAQMVSWVDRPMLGVGSLFTEPATRLLAHFNTSPFPEINGKAQQAKVPVMMYHDILPEKQVFFDVTPAEFEQHLKLIQEKGLTPITMDQLMLHLRTGAALPEKPILLTFDDGYEGHYTYVYPLLKKYNYPAVFSIYTVKVGKKMGRSSVSWEQVREMAKDPLITIASHSVNHKVMPDLTDSEVQFELQESKRILEAELGIPIRYFTYPEGKYNAKIAEAVQAAGYISALTMSNTDEKLAGESTSLLAIERIGQSRIAEMVEVATGGIPEMAWHPGFNFETPIQKVSTTIDSTDFILISGGRPTTIHAKTRGQLPDLLAGTQAIAAVDGAFFSLLYLDSNEMLGPVLSSNTGRFIPGKKGEIPLINNRPLVLISSNGVRFVPFNNKKHNTLEGIQAELPGVTDAFVGAGFLVENGQPQPPERFGKLFDFNAARHRAFWGINRAGQPVVGVSTGRIGSVDLGVALAKAGLRDAVMLDSGASTSLAYKGESLIKDYTPRPVPHLVALIPPESEGNRVCAIASAKIPAR
jgi:peptidoglycan/xylan/chitin deacetylase (PgdA/CDA1 family)